MKAGELFANLCLKLEKAVIDYYVENLKEYDRTNNARVTENAI